jgi:2-oxoglutarate ferredoxin oxidoreductase subunit delta
MKQAEAKCVVVETIKVPKGTINILKDRCKGCGFCVEFCPKKVLELSHENNTKGYHPPLVKYPEKCISCGLCTRYCPDFAIYQARKDGVKDEE